METAVACGSAHSPLQDKRTAARLHPEAKVPRRGDASFVNILALGLHSAGVSRF